MNISNILELVRTGGRPIVTCKPGIDVCEGYAEAGIKARIVGGRLSSNDVVHLMFDYHEFESHNTPLESANYRDGSGGHTKTAHEAGEYKPVEELYFDPSHDTAELFEVASDDQMKLYEQYLSSQAATSYVSWLERRVIDQEAALQADLCQEASQHGLVRGTASGAYDELVESYPSILTPARRDEFVDKAVKTYLEGQSGSAIYLPLREVIETAAKEIEAELALRRESAPQRCGAT